MSELTTEQLYKVVTDMVLGLPPSINGKEADLLRYDINADIRAGLYKLSDIDVPFEIPNVGQSKTIVRLKGGEGSGNHGHAGIPGHQGGSAPGQVSPRIMDTIRKFHYAEYAKSRDKRQFMLSLLNELKTDLGLTTDIQILDDAAFNADIGNDARRAGANPDMIRAGFRKVANTIKIRNRLLTDIKDANTFRLTLNTLFHEIGHAYAASIGKHERENINSLNAYDNSKNEENADIMMSVLGLLYMRAQYQRGEATLVPRTIRNMTDEHLFVQNALLKEATFKGGEGSGNHGHAGIPGHQGGSQPTNTASYVPANSKINIDDHEKYAQFKEYWKSHHPDYPDLDAVIADIWERDYSNGITSSITDIETSSDFALYIMGTLTDAEGRTVGHFKRRMGIIDSKNIHHEEFTIGKKFQGQGIGSEFVQTCEDLYRKYGFDTITLYADLDVGGYAWARMGYDFDGYPGMEDVYDTMTDRWKSKYPGTKFPVTWDKDMHSWTLASVIGPDGALIGKEVMLEVSWEGKKYLNDNVAQQVSKAYYASRKGKKK